MVDENTDPVVEEEVKEETPEETPETPEKDEILDALTDTEDESEETPEKEEPKEEVDETESEEEKSDDETPTEGEPKEAEEEKKEEAKDPKEEARNQYEERQKSIAERKARVKTQTDDYVSKGEDDTEQRLRAMEGQSYTNLIENNLQSVANEFERVKANPDLQIFNQDSDQYNKGLYDKAIRDYNAGYLTYDANENMTEVKGSLYQHLKETADLYQGAVKSGQVQQVRDSRKMNTNADPKVAAPPKEVEKDPILDILLSD